MIDILFYIFSAIAVGSAAIVLFTKNLLYAAFALVATFLCVSVIYVLANAEFLAVTQIMIYVGGIIVLLIFGIMLTNKVSGLNITALAHNQFPAVVLATSLFLLLLFGIFKMNFQVVAEQPFKNNDVNNVHQLGVALMSDYILPFEISAIILLIALVGAATISAHKNNADEY